MCSSDLRPASDAHVSFPPPAAAPPPRAPLRITTGIVRDWSGLLRVIVLALLLLGLPGGLDIRT